MATEKQLNIILESELEFKPYTNTSNMSENHPGYAPDTDARSQAPTFDEMVAMIEKLFKDYLKDIRKNVLTDEQIEEGWQRYKTLNHLYQDEQPKPAGAVWVKGAPKELKQCFARVPSVIEDDVIYDAVIWPTSNPDYWWAAGHGFKFSIHKDKITEYLDESGTASNKDDEWIDVNDRLPEEAGRYWCYIKHLTDLGFSYFQWNCDYNPQLRRFSDMTLKDGEQITHWRPLAEPPTIKQEGHYP